MFKKVITNVFLKRRHFWRYANFDEVSKLYVARTLRTFALRLVAVFVSIYLFNLGYSLTFIFIYLGLYHLVKIPMAYLASYSVIKLGSKHTIFYANILYIPTILALTFVQPPGDPMTILILGGIILVQSMSVSMYEYSTMLNFAKTKSVKSMGRDLGMINILEKTASIIGPIAGGLIASLWGPQVLMVIASVILGIAAVPLIKTAEPINKTQKIRWRRYPWRKTWRSLLSQGGAGFDIIISGSAWQLYLAALVFSLNQEIYAVVGVLSSISTVAAFLSAFAFGRLIDKKHGKLLLLWGVRLKAVTSFMRPMVNAPIGAAVTSAAAEVSSTAYSMAFMRGTYDLADRSPYRLNYLLLMVIASDVGAVIACFFGATLFLLADMRGSFTVLFILSAFAILIISSPKFPLYKH